MPNTFQAGQPARAAEVNANFSELESAANQNASDISANSAEIAASDVAIQSNTSDISAIGTAAGLHLYSQGVSIGRYFAANSASSLANNIFLISKTGYLFLTSWDGTDPYLKRLTYYYSQPGCTGSIYFEANSIRPWVAATGGVFTSTQFPLQDNRYVPRGSISQLLTTNSREANIIGGCFDETLTQNYYVPIPNDEAITGVPDVEPPRPYTIGVP